MQMLSIENGKVYTENYNINHIINSLYDGHCDSCTRQNDSFTTSRNNSHIHVILSNSQAPEGGHKANQYTNTIPTAFTFPVQGNLNASLIVRFLDLHAQLKLLPLRHSALLKSTVLLI